MSTPFTLMLHHLKLFSVWVSQQHHLLPLEHSGDSTKPVSLLTHSERRVDLTCYCSSYITGISYVWLWNVPIGSCAWIFECQLGVLYRDGRWCLVGGREDKSWELGSTLLLELSLLLGGGVPPIHLHCRSLQLLTGQPVYRDGCRLLKVWVRINPSYSEVASIRCVVAGWEK